VLYTIIKIIKTSVLIWNALLHYLVKFEHLKMVADLDGVHKNYRSNTATVHLWTVPK